MASSLRTRGIQAQRRKATETAVEEVEPRRGLIPNLGVGQLGRELGGGLAGLARLGHSLLPGGPRGGDVFREAGRGFLSSLGGTFLATPAALVGQDEAVERGIGKFIGGEQYQPQDLFQAVGERGLLAPLVETVGNVALGAGAASGVLRGASGVARLAGATEAAESLSAARTALQARPMWQWTAHPYQQVFRKAINPEIQAAVEAQRVSAGVDDVSQARDAARIDPGIHTEQVEKAQLKVSRFERQETRWREDADRVRAQTGTEDAAYDAALRAGRRRSRPGLAEQITGEVPGTQTRQAAATRARGLADPVTGAQRLDRLAGIAGEKAAAARAELQDVATMPERAAQRLSEAEAELAARPAPNAIQRAVRSRTTRFSQGEGLTASARAAVALENRFKARVARRTARQASRLFEVDRNVLHRSPAVQQSIVAARDYLVRARGMDRELASQVAGQEIYSRIYGRDRYSTIIPEAMRDQIMRGLEWRHPDMPVDLIDDPGWNQAMDQISNLWDEANTRHLDIARSGRIGEEGLEQAGRPVEEVLESGAGPVEDRMARDIHKNLQEARRLETDVVPRERGRIEDVVAKLDEMLESTQLQYESLGDLASEASRISGTVTEQTMRAARQRRAAVVEARGASLAREAVTHRRLADATDARLENLHAEREGLQTEMDGITNKRINEGLRRTLVAEQMKTIQREMANLREEISRTPDAALKRQLTEEVASRQRELGELRTRSTELRESLRKSRPTDTRRLDTLRQQLRRVDPLITAARHEYDRLEGARERTVDRANDRLTQADSLRNEAESISVDPVSRERALERAARLEERMRVKRLTQQQLVRQRERMTQVLNEGSLPSEQMAASLDARARRKLAALEERMRNPEGQRIPREWQPVMDDFDALQKAALNHPELADIIEDIPENFSQALQLAREKGFNPRYVRDLTPRQVEQLVWGALRLHPGGVKNVGQSMRGGFRTKSTGVLRRSGEAERSIEALEAGLLGVVNEQRINMLTDVIENQIARPIPPGGKLFPGWSEWDAERHFLVHGEEMGPTARMAQQQGREAARGAGLMIPDVVKRQLRKSTAPAPDSALAKVARSRPMRMWRTALLTLSPRWYVNNFVGNTILAAHSEGVSVKDWATAWKKVKAGQGRFGGGGLVAEGDLVDAQRTLIPRERGVAGMKQARQEEGLRGVAGEGARRLRRGNEFVDEVAREYVASRAQKRGLSDEAAVQRAYETMVDYGDLSPEERTYVRAFIPFYSWQKGILKRAAMIPIDHPARAGLMAHLGRLNEEMARDQFGGEQAPEIYSQIVGGQNLRSMNPFSDAFGLASLQGIISSMNPAAEILLRNATGGPEAGYSERYRMTPWGGTQPEVDVMGELAQNVIGSLPQLQVLASLTNAESIVGREVKDRPAAIGSYLGLPRVSEEQLAKVKERLAKSRKKINQAEARAQRGPVEEEPTSGQLRARSSIFTGR